MPAATAPMAGTPMSQGFTRGIVARRRSRHLNRSSAGQKAASLQVCQKPIDFRVALHAMEPVSDIVGNQLNFSRCDRFAVMHAILQAVERGAFGMIANRRLRPRRLPK